MHRCLAAERAEAYVIVAGKAEQYTRMEQYARSTQISSGRTLCWAPLLGNSSEQPEDRQLDIPALQAIRPCVVSHMASPNPPPTWATQDPDEKPSSRASNNQGKHPSADVDEEMDVAAASSVVGSSPVKSVHPSDRMEVDEEEDAETARNRAAEALSDLANAAVFAAPMPTNTSIANEPSGRMYAPQISTPTDVLAKQKRRPAALLTPTRRSGPAKGQHLSPNLSAAGSSSARRSPLAAILDHTTPSLSAGQPEGSVQDQNAIPLTTNANGINSPLYSASPNRADRGPGAEKGKPAYNSPFTNQPFVRIRVLPLSRLRNAKSDRSSAFFFCPCRSPGHTM